MLMNFIQNYKKLIKFSKVSYTDYQKNKFIYYLLFKIY